MRLPHFSVEKFYFDPRTHKLFEQEYLMGIIACKPIGAVDIDLINASCCHHIAQLFQGWSDECRATVASIDELMLWWQQKTTGLHMSSQFTELAFNRFGLILLFRGNPSVDRNLKVIHDILLSPMYAED